MAAGRTNAIPKQLLLWRPEYVCHRRGPGSADALRHPNPSINLVGAGVTPQLLRKLYDLIHTGGAHWIPSCFLACSLKTFLL